jgi:TolB-like protein/Flp pilus assembly protein TadD/predicted Ser/Thr protein kinase
MPPGSLTGTQLLHYRLSDRLGGGGMGEVYLAEDTRLGRQVALKFLPPETQRDQDSRALLVREARAASVLRSPNIAVTYDLLEDGDALFIAMEYVDGETLAARLTRGSLKIREAVDIAQQVADALDEAHTHGIIHRDIKSANLMLTRRGLVKVLDFGLARFEERGEAFRRETALQLTSPGLVRGTVSYMAPEQLLGATFDHRVDIFALGVVVYEMIAGRLPFVGETFAEITDRILHAEPDALVRSDQPVPSELDAIVRKALQKMPDFRYQSAREMYVDLHQLARRLDTVDTTAQVRLRTPSAGFPAVSGEVAQGERLIAIMTFANVTREAADDWIGEGIAETVTSDLKNVAGLAVVGRTQIFEMLKHVAAGRDAADPRLAIEIGRRLGAWWVVTGAYQRLGPRIRITVQVTEVLTASLVKTLKIDGSVDDIFALQDRIVFELSRSLDLRVGRPEAEAIEQDETKSVEAFEAYSRGLINMRQATRESIDRALALFERATTLDPEYAAAWAAAGGSLQLKGLFGGTHEFSDRAIELLRRAIALKPSLTDAHVWLGMSLLNLGRLSEGIEALRQATRLEPDNANALQALARTLWMGEARVDEAIALLRQAVASNPDAGYAYLQLAFLEALNGELDAAEASARRALDLQLQAVSGTQGLLIVGANTRLGYVHYLRGDYAAARDEYFRERDFLARTDHGLRERSMIELHQKLSALSEAQGNAQEAAHYAALALSAFEARLATGADDPATRYYIAAIYARRGDVARTLEHLAPALSRYPQFTQWRLQRDPDFARVRSDAVFIEGIVGARGSNALN